MFDRSYVLAHKGHPHFISNSRILYLSTKTDSEISEKNLEVIKNLSDPTKLKIYLLLTQVAEIPVTDIKHILGLSQSAVSHALSDLRKIGLVEARRCGQLICYSLKRDKSGKLLTIVKKFLWN